MSTRATATEQAVTPLGLQPQSHHRVGWSGNRSLVAGLIVIGIIILAAVFAPLLTSHDPTHQDLLHPLQGFSSRHPLGTDDLGRDVWAQLLYGARVDLQVAFLAVLFPFLIGTTLGCLAGYYGRWVDVIVMRAVEIVVAFPFYVLILALVFVLGQGTRSIYIAITMVGWVSYARIVRGEVLTAKRREYVLAAQVAGLRDGRIIARHLLPNVITQALVFAMSDIVLDILVIVALGYLGLGVPPPTPDWGRMIADGQNFITTHWQIATIPGLAVVLVGLGLSLVGDGLADFLRIE
jgi:peptide/nickel transport system permease protein